MVYLYFFSKKTEELLGGRALGRGLWGTYGRTIAQFSCKLSYDPNLWNARESRLNGKSREAVTTNGKLERLLLSAQSAYQALCERGVVFTETDIKELLQGSMQSQITLLERYDQLLEEMKQKVGIEIKGTTLSSYNTTLSESWGIRKVIIVKWHYGEEGLPFGIS